jgi:hypothetical protein
LADVLQCQLLLTTGVMRQINLSESAFGLVLQDQKRLSCMRLRVKIAFS